MEAELLLYTEEQEEKINRLRAEAVREREEKKKWIKRLNQDYGALSEFKEGDPVFVKFDGKSIAGRIIKVRTEKKTMSYTRTTTKIQEFTVYDVKTPLGNVTVPQSWEYIQQRFVEDLSGVEIPEELKKINTRQLLSYLKGARIWGDCAGFSREQIKAELALRPHIRTKRELQKFNTFKKKSKKK